MVKIVSGFPGVGKSFLTKHSKLSVADSDSSKFSWIEPGVRHPDFPQNYIEHIESIMDECDIIMVSTHKVVRDALRENGIPFMLVYPNRQCKAEYLQRYIDRNSPDGFVKLMDNNWDTFIAELEDDPNETKVILGQGSFLTTELIHT